MIKVIVNNLGSADWIVVQGHSGSTLFSDSVITGKDLCDILDVVSRDGCEFIEVTDEQMNREYAA